HVLSHERAERSTSGQAIQLTRAAEGEAAGELREPDREQDERVEEDAIEREHAEDEPERGAAHDREAGDERARAARRGLEEGSAAGRRRRALVHDRGLLGVVTDAAEALAVRRE